MTAYFYNTGSLHFLLASLTYWAQLFKTDPICLEQIFLDSCNYDHLSLPTALSICVVQHFYIGHEDTPLQVLFKNTIFTYSIESPSDLTSFGMQTETTQWYPNSDINCVDYTLLVGSSNGTSLFLKKFLNMA